MTSMRKHYLIIFLICVGWAILVVVSGFEFPIGFGRPNFLTSSDFGESFGGLSAIMAAAAAAFTFQALLESREVNQRLRSRELARDSFDALARNEDTLFKLFELRISVISSMELEITVGKKSGLSVIEYINNSILDSLQSKSTTNKKLAYESSAARFSEQLARYHNVNINIIRFISYRFEDVEDRTVAMNHFKSQLSSSESISLAMYFKYSADHLGESGLADTHALFENLPARWRRALEEDRVA